MKNLTPVFGIGLVVLSGLASPVLANPFGGASGSTSNDSGSTSTIPNSLPQPSNSNRMAIYRDCIDAHADLKDADFSKVNKFCSCVADQTLQGDNSGLSNCASNSGGGGGGVLGSIGEMAPTILSGVLDGLGSSRSRRGGLLDGLGGILGGSILGGGGIRDIFK